MAGLICLEEYLFASEELGIFVHKIDVSWYSAQLDAKHQDASSL
jgi:hypothetical protein